MARFEKNKKIYKILYSRIALVLFAIIVVYLFFSVLNLYKKDREVTKNKIQVTEQYDVLNTKQTTLQKEIDSLNSPRGQEESIRDKFRVVKDGEQLIIIPEDQTAAVRSVVAPSDQTGTTQKSSHFWSFIKEWFSPTPFVQKE